MKRAFLLLFITTLKLNAVYYEIDVVLSTGFNKNPMDRALKNDANEVANILNKNSKTKGIYGNFEASRGAGLITMANFGFNSKIWLDSKVGIGSSISINPRTFYEYEIKSKYYQDKFIVEGNLQTIPVGLSLLYAYYLNSPDKFDLGFEFEIGYIGTYTSAQYKSSDNFATYPTFATTNTKFLNGLQFKIGMFILFETDIKFYMNYKYIKSQSLKLQSKFSSLKVDISGSYLELGVGFMIR